MTLDAGAYIGNAGDYVRALAGKPTRCYRIPYMHYHGQVISSNSPVSGAFRSWSAAEEALMMERQLDAAAEKLGMDRLAIRLKNVARSGATAGASASGSAVTATHTSRASMTTARAASA